MLAFASFGAVGPFVDLCAFLCDRVSIKNGRKGGVDRGWDAHLGLRRFCTFVRFVLGFLGTTTFFLRVPALWSHYCADIRFLVLETKES